MNKIKSNIFFTKFLYVLGMVTLIGCKNSSKEINDFLADQNLPIGIAEDLNHIYKDSGRVTSRLITPVLWDYSNRKMNPYSEFPKGVKIVSINRETRDSVTVTGDYAISFTNNNFSEIIGNVVIINHQKGVILNSNQMYWDQNENYFFTESPFTLYTEKDTLHGVGFESESDLNNWILNNTKGNFVIDQKEEK